MNNSEWVVKAYSSAGLPGSECAEFRPCEMPSHDLKEGHVLIQTLYVSVDPYQRGRLLPEGPGYMPPYPLDQPITGELVGVVLESNSSTLRPGHMIKSLGPWQAYFSKKATACETLQLEEGESVTNYLSVMGVTGLSAYFGVVDVCRPKVGDVAFVTGAAGAVGSIAGQLLKLLGCSLVIGSAGTDEKVDILTRECGFDVAINYKTLEGPLSETLRELAPDGIDVFFDCVGGETLTETIKCMKRGGRIAICGAISQYTLSEEEKTMLNPRVILTQGLKVQGFILTDYKQHFSGARAILRQLTRDGRLNPLETIVEGFDHAFEAFRGLFSGKNIGKYLVAVGAPPPTSDLLYTPPSVQSLHIELQKLVEEKRALEAMKSEFGHLLQTSRIMNSLHLIERSIDTDREQKERLLASSEEKYQVDDEDRQEEEKGEELEITQPSSSSSLFVSIDRFSWDDGGYGSSTVTVYVDLEGVGEIKDQVSCSFTPSSFDLKVLGLQGHDYRLIQEPLFKEIDPETSRIKVKRNKVSIKLSKVRGEYNYESWTSLTDKKNKKNNGRGGTPSSSPGSKSTSDNPMASLMDMMKDMYEDGDDNMRKVIGEAMEKAQKGQPAGSAFDSMDAPF